MVPALWKMVRNCRTICREWSQRWWKEARYDSWHVLFFHKLRNNRNYLGSLVYRYNIYTDIFVTWWQVLVVLFISVFWFLYDTCYWGQRVTTSVQEGVQPGSVLTVAVPNPGGVPQGLDVTTDVFFTRVVVVCVCSTLQILGVGLVILSSAVVFFCDRKIWWKVFRTYDKETLQKRILHQGEAEHNWKAAPPERFLRISTLRGSDAPAPASSPPPAAPANSVNISDGLAPAREAGAKNGEFFVNLFSICLVKVRYC